MNIYVSAYLRKYFTQKEAKECLSTILFPKDSLVLRAGFFPADWEILWNKKAIPFFIVIFYKHLNHVRLKIKLGYWDQEVNKIRHAYTVDGDYSIFGYLPHYLKMILEKQKNIAAIN